MIFWKKRKPTEPNSSVKDNASLSHPEKSAHDGDTSQKTWLSRLKDGLSKSSSKLSEGIHSILVKRKLDNATLDQLEELLITSDLGVKTASEIVKAIAVSRYEKEVSEQELKEALAFEIEKILDPVTQALECLKEHTPWVVLVAGVNGNGKTTTIGKLAKQYHDQGKKVLVGACDTFRAAAVEQLEVWVKRAGCDLFKGELNADPASVAYQTIEKAKREAYDIVLIDTAGRLQTKTNLMQELEKIVRVIKKHDTDAPHVTALVLDATTGQNALSQAKLFSQAVPLSGLFVTKLDGTAKGGVVVALAKEFSLPIYAVGVGESAEDLQPFSAKSFARQLVGLSEKDDD